jgi:hypothetical protein
MLTRSSASPFLKRVLARKHSVRPTRFFGEAFVATQFTHEEGFYCPFKWLTSASWSGESSLNDRDAREFKAALAKYFPRLAELQARANRAREQLGGEKPVGPDLWLVTAERHQFIEVKLPKDGLAERQVAGLALLATGLPSDRPIEVVSVSLDRTSEQFEAYVKAFMA